MDFNFDAFILGKIYFSKVTLIKWLFFMYLIIFLYKIHLFYLCCCDILILLNSLTFLIQDIFLSEILNLHFNHHSQRLHFILKFYLIIPFINYSRIFLKSLHQSQLYYFKVL
jgi:hypothetical protein